MNPVRYILLFICLQANLTAFTENVPSAVRDSLKVLFPSVRTVGWNTDGNYYVAGFQSEGFVVRVWFDTQGHWVMRQTDWGNLDEAPMPVYHTFTYGPYSTDNVLDVTLAEFPHQTSQVVVRIGIDNALTEYQLFYYPDGTLINARNVTYMNNILGANTFL